MGSSILNINDLYTKVDDKEILKGVNLNVNKGEVHVIMGPNGAGKSTLANTLMGHPKYEVVSGDIEFLEENINELKVYERARKGMFLSFQHPEEINGITVDNFIKTAVTNVRDEKVKPAQFRKDLKNKMEELKIGTEYSKRYLNVGFSGGEKKKNEILQLSMLNPKLAILDETDSGLDVDAIKIVSKGVNLYANEDNAVIIITHNNRILDNIKVDYVHILVDGKIIKSGDISLAKEIEEFGYGKFREESSNASKEAKTLSFKAV